MKNLYYLCMYGLFALVFSNEFIPLDASLFQAAATGGILVFLAATLSMTRGFQLYVSLLSLAAGHLILFSYGLGYDVWSRSLTKGIGMPVLFVVIPLIAFPIRYGDYLDAIGRFVARRAGRPGRLFAFLTFLHLAFTVALNIGSIPTMQKLLGGTGLSRRYLAKLYTTGYASYMVFSPYDPVVNMVLLLTGIGYSSYVLGGGLMVGLILLTSTLFLRFDGALDDYRPAASGSDDRAASGSDRKVYELLGHVIALILLAFAGERLLPFSSVLYGIVVIIIAYSVFWGGLLGVLGRYRDELRSYSRNLDGFRNFLPFLLSATFLGSVFSHTPIRDAIAANLAVLNALPLYFVIMLMILLTMLLALCGVHMLITITALAFTVSPEVLGLSAPAFALTLLTCWFIAMCISPLVPFAVVVADTVGEKPLNVTFRHNLKFSLTMLFTAPLLILAVNMLHGL